jgi:hypothetical protein
MLPPELSNYFLATAGAGAALIGLLFVAVSIAPEQIATRRAPLERQAVAASTFTALVNAFFCYHSLQRSNSSSMIDIPSWNC